MAQLSRPYQIGLAAIVLLAAVWLVLLQGHSSSPSSPAASATVAPVSTTPSTAASTNAGTKSSSKAGTQASAPGVAGLTRAIEKAHGAAAVSQQTNRQLQEKSAQASTTGSTPSTPSASSSTAAPAKTAAPTVTTPSKSAQATVTAPSSTKAKAEPNVASRLSSPTRQHDVEGQLAKGKVALILFWNPKGADDREIHNALGKLSAKDIAVNQAPASEIASFGTITRGIQVYGTPTLLIVDKKGETITLTGPQDAFVIDQAISEARHP